MKSFILVVLALALAACTGNGGGTAPTSKTTEGPVVSTSQHLEGPDLIAIPYQFTLGEPDTSAERLVTFYGSFSLDTTEVTSDQYQACYDAGYCSAPGTDTNCNWGVTGHEDYPINCTTYVQATAYCAWAGKRLPTVYEREYAARYPDERTWPWGNDDSSYLTETNSVASGDGYTYTSPVGNYPAGNSALGLEDMVGNVWDMTQSPWCSSETGACTNCPEGQTCDDACDVCGTHFRYMAGGDYGDGVSKTWTRQSTDMNATTGDPRVGFRCAKDN